MKTPKQKAKQLVDKMHIKPDLCFVMSKAQAKQCALIAVDEIINLLPNINMIPPIDRKPDEFYFQYWNIVKKEIEKL